MAGLVATGGSSAGLIWLALGSLAVLIVLFKHLRSGKTYLHLRRDRFRYSFLGRVQDFDWRHCSTFKVRYWYYNLEVWFTYDTRCDWPETSWHTHSKIPLPFGMSQEKLADLMNRFRERARLYEPR